LTGAGAGAGGECLPETDRRLRSEKTREEPGGRGFDAPQLHYVLIVSISVLMYLR